MNVEEELNEYVREIEDFLHLKCPSWLTPNSVGMGVEPGHNLDLLKVWMDFRVDRISFLTHKADVPEILTDPSKPNLKVLK